MKRILIVCLVSGFFFTSCNTLKNFLVEPTSLETITALKEVLNSSSFKAIGKLKQMQNGGVMALLPPELGPVLNTLKTLGIGEDIDVVTKQIEKASLIVAEESTAIMKDAISEVKFGDAVAIVIGGEDAATQVLRNAMYGSVKKRYSTRLDQELEKAEVNQYWGMAAGAYNIFAKEKIDDKLSDFMAERAVDGLFIAMGKEEKDIRTDPASLGKAVVTKVFDYYEKKKGKRS